MKERILLAMSLFASCGMAYAQTACPNGVAPGSSQCGQSPTYHGVTPTPSAPQSPQIRWADRWGAIATDGASASIGTAVQMRSQRKAKKAALKVCRAKGGQKCEIDLAYHNQCAVMVLGDKKYFMQGAPTIEKASQVGRQKCSKSDTNCRIYYSGCSLPVRIQ
jgi:hypothetical protein